MRDKGGLRNGSWPDSVKSRAQRKSRLTPCHPNPLCFYFWYRVVRKTNLLVFLLFLGFNQVSRYDFYIYMIYILRNEQLGMIVSIASKSLHADHGKGK